MFNIVPNRANSSKRQPKIGRNVHYHTEYTDPQYGYPLNKDGDWALDDEMNITDDSASEIHYNKKDCEGTGCQYYSLPKQDRADFHGWAADHLS